MRGACLPDFQDHAVYQQLYPTRNYVLDTNQSITQFGWVGEVTRYKYCSIMTGRTYVDWIRRFVSFHGRCHPREKGADEVRAFLGHLTANLELAVATHRQALSAPLFYYRNLLELPLPWLDNLNRLIKPKHLPMLISPVGVEVRTGTLLGAMLAT